MGECRGREVREEKGGAEEEGSACGEAHMGEEREVGTA